jgi:cytochrome bd-type quinol oxidase subunit 1
VPELYLLGWFLLVLGAWGVLLLLNRQVLPGVDLADVHYRRMAIAMLVALPLGVLVMVATRALQLRGRKPK